jgi:hypothetical protein
MVLVAWGSLSPVKPRMKAYGLSAKNIAGLSCPKLPTTACWHCSQPGRPVKMLAQRRLLRPMYAGKHQDNVEKPTGNKINKQEDEEESLADLRIEEETAEDGTGVR